MAFVCASRGSKVGAPISAEIMKSRLKFWKFSFGVDLGRRFEKHDTNFGIN